MGSKQPTPPPGTKKKSLLSRVKSAMDIIVHPESDGFKERVTPIKPGNTLFFFKCSCGHTHFRHAGYMKLMLPYLKHDGDKRVSVDAYQVMVCVKCKRCHVWANEQMYDVTDQVDLQAWEKTEREAHRATGPGGDC
jgi:hypothetical protein